MRCGRVGKLIERYVDGRLPATAMEAVSTHERTCARCAARIAAARGVAEAIAVTAEPKAPSGFLDAVMDAVYREALCGTGRGPGPAPVRPAARGRIYRRLGYCLVFSAAVFAAAPLVPWLAVTGTAVPSLGGGSAVKRALLGAGLTVRGVLHSNGGSTK